MVSVDTKKKELVGDFKNTGKQWRPKQTRTWFESTTSPTKWEGDPLRRVRPDAEHRVGQCRHRPRHGQLRCAHHLEVVEEDGTAGVPERAAVTGHRGRWRQQRAAVRLWKWEMQQLADRVGMSITRVSLPPGTSKWNKIEHRLFSYISTNWRGQPLSSHEVVVNSSAPPPTAEAERPRRSGQGRLRARDQSHRRTNGGSEHRLETPLVPRGVELHGPPRTTTV